MFSIDIDDQTYWLEYKKTNYIDKEIIEKYKDKLPKFLQEEINTDKYYQKLFNNEICESSIEDFENKINKMKGEWEQIKFNPVGFINFNKIRDDHIKKRIYIIHTLFSLSIGVNKVLPPDILDIKTKWFFLEQFPEDVKGSIRIFHLIRIENGKITIFPLFIDTKHQIIPFVVKNINKLGFLIKLMVKHNIKTISDLKWNLSDKEWLECNSIDMEEIRQFYKYQNTFEIHKFILVDEKLVDFIDWLFKNYDLMTK